MTDSVIPIIYRYFGDYSDNNDHLGIICVASQLDREQNSLRLGASFCSPKDPFIKSKAKLIAKGRLINDRTAFIFTLAPSFKINYENLNKLTIKLINFLPRYPNTGWTRRLIKQLESDLSEKGYPK